jgi:hypothetical protein
VAPVSWKLPHEEDLEAEDQRRMAELDRHKVRRCGNCQVRIHEENRTGYCNRSACRAAHLAAEAAKFGRGR